MDEQLAATILELAQTSRHSDAAALALHHLLAGFRKHSRSTSLVQAMSAAIGLLECLQTAQSPEDRAETLDRLEATCAQLAAILRTPEAASDAPPRSDTATWFE